MKEILGKVKNAIKTVCDKIGEKLMAPINKLKKTKAGGKIIAFLSTPVVSYLLLAFGLNIILEALSRHSFKKAFAFMAESPLVFLYNVFIIFVTLSLVLFATRKIFATIFVCTIWILSAFANFLVLSFRTTPFSAIDILMIRNVMTMIDKYMEKWQMVLAAIAGVLLILLLIYLYVRLPKRENKIKPLRASAYVCMCFIFVWILTKAAVKTQTISDNFGNLNYAYRDYGFAYCFSNSVIDTGISEPKGYSEEAVKKIVANMEYDKSDVIFTVDPAEKSRSEEATSNKDLAEKTTEAASEDVNGETTEKSSEDASKEEAKVENAEDDSKAENAEDDSKAETDEDAEGTEETETAKEKKQLPGQAEPFNDTENKLSPRITTEADEDAEYFKNEPATKENPNIIIVQIESAIDVKYMKDLIPSERPMPTFSLLKNMYSSGYFTVPAVGAGTANTEFEVLTGMSTQFFGAGEYPFKTIMRKQTVDSIAYDLKRQGYVTTGFHNNDATFYERFIDYSDLGFDSFSGMEHMYNLNYTPRGWAKDNVLDDIMIERMKQTPGRDYINTISVQGHGRYPKKHTDTMTNLTCTFRGKYAKDKQKMYAWEYYINMIRESDMMIADLIDKVNELGEPTVIFMYGDHLPALNIEESDLRDINLFQTEWVMWDNIGLEKQDKDLYAYQASTYIFNRLGLKGGLMQHFHNRYMNSKDRKKYLADMKMLQYDTIYGKDYAFDQHNPFPKTDMTMGIRDIKLDGFTERTKEVRINGEGFNEFSVVYINGEPVETKWLNYRTLVVSKEDFEDAKDIYVAQAGDDHLVLTTTNTINVAEVRKQQKAEADAKAVKKTDKN